MSDTHFVPRNQCLTPISDGMGRDGGRGRCESESQPAGSSFFHLSTMARHLGLRRSTCIAALAAALPSIAAAQQIANDAEIRDMLATRVATGKNPGIVVGIFTFSSGATANDKLDPAVRAAIDSGRTSKVIVLGRTQLFEPVGGLDASRRGTRIAIV